MTNSLSNIPVKTLVKQDKVQEMVRDTLSDKAPQFLTSIVSVVNANRDLQNVDQMSIIQSAMIATTLDLPINQNLGFMWLVPYKGKATAQIGYKGYIQLAQKTGKYKSMNAVPIYEGELKSWNPLTEEVNYDPTSKKSDKVIGYIGYFKLINGFEKTVYWTKEQIDDHRKRFSKMSSRDKPTGVWASDFDAMALKTVLRNMLSKWGPMTTQMETALTHDEEAPTDEEDTNSEDHKGKTDADVTFDIPEEKQKEADKFFDQQELKEGEFNDDSDKDQGNEQTTTEQEELFTEGPGAGVHSKR